METEDQQTPQGPPDESGRKGESGPFSSVRRWQAGSVNMEELYLHYARQLHRWGTLGGRTLKVDLLQMPGVGNSKAALMRAEAMGRSGRAVGYGSADAGLVGSNDPERLLECAELVAKIDALSVALKTLRPAAAGVSMSGPGARGSQLQQEIPLGLTPHQPIDLARPPQGEGARIYQYFHQLIAQMEQRARPVKEQDLGMLDQAVQLGQDLSFSADTQALLLASHAIEDEFVQKHLSAPLYVGFQYFSRLRSQEPRYRAILRSSQRVVVFGLADVPLWYEPRFENVAIDVQSGTGLERFWFVATRGPEWNTALLAENLPSGFSRPRDTRQYQGFWTFDLLTIERIVGTLDYARAFMLAARQS